MRSMQKGLRLDKNIIFERLCVKKVTLKQVKQILEIC